MAPILPALWDRYHKTEGRIHLTGVEALVRIALDQLRRDRREGRRMAAFYSSSFDLGLSALHESPQDRRRIGLHSSEAVAALDPLLRALAPLLVQEQVRYQPVSNDALAASAVAGTQMIDVFPHEQHEGVLGIWFGSALGLERALSAIRRANFQGISRLGAAVALVGDDSLGSSESLPTHSERALAYACVPVLCPADAGEILTLGRHAFALSRYAGTWTALKVTSDLARSGLVIDVPRREPELILPKLEIDGRAFQKRLDATLLPSAVLRVEEELIYERLEAVRRYAHANGLDPIEHRHARDRIGLVSSGRLYRELETALTLLGLGADALERSGIRVLRMQLLYPCNPRRVREFADGLDEVIVLDERRGFLEEQLRSVLCNTVDRPRVLGQLDERGAPWLARHAQITSETVALDLGAHLARQLCDDPLRSRALQIASRRALPIDLSLASPESRDTDERTGRCICGAPRSSGKSPEQDRADAPSGTTGCEGAYWIGLAPYVELPHFVEKLDLASYASSGRAAVRAAVSSGAKLTYEIRMGRRDAESLADRVCELLEDGVARVFVASRDPRLLCMAEREPRLEIIESDRFERTRRSLGELFGVSVLIDDRRAAEAELARRFPDHAVVSLRDLCGDCPDCAHHARASSLHVLETLPCVGRAAPDSPPLRSAGWPVDCPAYLTFPTTAFPQTAAKVALASIALPEPESAALSGSRFQIAIAGDPSLVGKTSDRQIAIDAVLIRAAEIEGLRAIHLQSSPRAQGLDAVLSHCILGPEPIAGSPRVSVEGADALLVLDSSYLVDVLRLIQPDRSGVVIHEPSPFATARCVPDESPAARELAGAVETRSRKVCRIAAGTLAEVVLGDSELAPGVLLGAMLQQGDLPLRVAAVECAIRDYGIAVDATLMALRLGRIAVAHPERAQAWISQARARGRFDSTAPDEARRKLPRAWAALDRLLSRFGRSEIGSELRVNVGGWALDLCEYRSSTYGERYLAILRDLLDAEVRAGAKQPRVTALAARELHRTMAYKDGYEVARLLLRGPFRRWLRENHIKRRGVRYHLQPSLMGCFGLQREHSVAASWFEPVLAVLVFLRRLREHRFDPFGWLAETRADRDRRDWYATVLRRLGARLDSTSLEQAARIVAEPAKIRGLGETKRDREEKIRSWVERALEAL